MSRLIVVFFVLLFSCQTNQTQVTVFSGIAMTIPYQVTVGSLLTKQQSEEIEHILLDTFKEVDQTYNKYNSSSELSTLNRLKENEQKTLSPGLTKLLQLVNHMVTLTDGKFDPTIEPLQRLWREKLELGRILTEEEIDSIKPKIGWHHIHLQGDLFWKDSDGVELDLGGIAKGYAVDLITERLVEHGYANVLVDWGGEFRSSGSHPEGRPWRVAVYQPNSAPNTPIISLENRALATSGNYFQNWTIETTDRVKTFSHVINIKSLKPIDLDHCPLLSVTVTAANCALADAIATAALMSKSKEEALEWGQHIENTIPDTLFLFLFSE